MYKCRHCGSVTLVPSAAPRDLQLQTASHTSLGISWKPVVPERRHGHLAGYIVVFWPRDEVMAGLDLPMTLQSICSGETSTENAEKQGLHVRKVYADVLQMELEELKVFTRYTATVTGFTSKGCGPWTDQVESQTDQYGKLIPTPCCISVK